jgi:hypothetical protein
MPHTAGPRNCNQSDFFLRCRSLSAILILVLAVSAAAFAQDVGEPNHPQGGLPATHLLGFAGSRNSTKGSLSIEGDALRFKKSGKADVEVKIASIHNLSLGDLSRQVGGVPLTLAKAALPYSGGRAVSLFSHKKYDTLTLEYVDPEGGLHGAIFELQKGQAESLRNQLVSKGAQASKTGQELTKQAAEASNENK